MNRIVEMFLFDTCTHKCAYCHFAESGKVLDASQLRPYRDPVFIETMATFFNKRTTADDKWLITLTGGEPLLMPNLAQFGSALWSEGNKLAFNTALLVGDNHPGFRFLLEEGRECTDYLMTSFHPEAEEIEDKFFERLRNLKEAGHRIIFRLIGHPARLNRLGELAARCRDLDIAFHPSPLFAENYPAGYSDAERLQLLSHASSLSQIILLKGGVSTDGAKCRAGSAVIAVDMRSGHITPCITVKSPIIGNIYDDELRLMPPLITCPLANGSCGCDIHFQQDIVEGAHDRSYFEAEKRGYVKPIDPAILTAQVSALGFAVGRQVMAPTDVLDFLALDNQFVKAKYESEKPWLTGGYAADNHPFYKTRQFPDRPPDLAEGTETTESAGVVTPHGGECLENKPAAYERRSAIVDWLKGMLSR